MSKGSGITSHALVLPESSAGVDTAPRGETHIRRIGAILQQSTDGAAYTTLGGGTSLANWGQQMFAVANAANALLVQYHAFPLDDITGVGWSSQISGAAAAATQSVAFGGGVVTLVSGTAASGVAAVQPPGTTTPSLSVINMKTDVPWFVAGRIRIDGPVDAQTFALMCMAAPNLTAFMGVGYDGQVGGSNFSVANLNAGLAVVEGHTLSTAIQLVNFVDVGLYCDGTVGIPYIGQVDAGTFISQPASQLVTSASFPTSTAVPVALIDNRTTAGTSRTMQVDSLFYARTKLT